MAKTALFPVHVFERDELPGICVLSGERTDSRLRVTVETRVSRAWMLFGLLAFAAARSGRPTATGKLPMTEEVYAVLTARRSQRRRTTLVCVGLVAGLVVVLLAVPALARSGIGALIGLAAILTCVAVARWASAQDPLAGLRLDRSGRWVELPGAADAFADTVHAQVKAGVIRS